MAKQDDRLDGLKIASPCTVSWESMKGDERVRDCSGCRLRVYNLSEMTKAEASRLIAEKEGRLCVRFFRRADGTVLTRDCPVGLRAARLKLARMAGAAVALVAALAAGLGLRLRFCPPAATTGVLMGAPAPMINMIGALRHEPRATMGEAAVEPRKTSGQ